MNKKSIFFMKNKVFGIIFGLFIGLNCSTYFIHGAELRPEVEEEIGFHSSGITTVVDAPVASRYENLNWWLSVIPAIYRNAGLEECDTYEKIVETSLNNCGLAYKNDIDQYIGKSLAEDFGLDNSTDDFESAFNRKLNEFQSFSIDYLRQKMNVSHKSYLEQYISEPNFFNGIFQKKYFRAEDQYDIFHIGDLHGDLISLLTILKKFENSFNSDFSLKDDKKFFVFTGDYIDRGQFGLEIIYILMSLKIKNPNNVFLTLGNHEVKHRILAGYDQGFAREVVRKLNLGAVDFDENKCVVGSGAASFSGFMSNLQLKFFRYVPVVLWFMTEFGKILFCHGLPDVMDREERINFLEKPGVEIYFSKLNLLATRFIDCDLAVEKSISGIVNPDPRVASALPLEQLGYYMTKMGILLCMRGHQHNPTIGLPWDIIQHGGVMRNQVSDFGNIITTLSFDFACCRSSLQILGRYANFCMIHKEGRSLMVQGFSIDRYSGNFDEPSDRTNPKFKFKLQDESSRRESDHAPASTSSTQQMSEINHEEFVRLCGEIEHLSGEVMSIFNKIQASDLQKYPLWVLRNVHYVFNRISRIHKIDLRMTKDILILLGILSERDSLDIKNLGNISNSDKLKLYSLMQNQISGVCSILENIKRCRENLCQSANRQDEKIEDFMQRYLIAMSNNRRMLEKKLREIFTLLGPIQQYLNPTGEFRQSVLRKLKSMVTAPDEDLTFDKILTSILGNSDQDVA